MAQNFDPNNTGNQGFSPDPNFNPATSGGFDPNFNNNAAQPGGFAPAPDPYAQPAATPGYDQAGYTDPYANPAPYPADPYAAQAPDPYAAQPYADQYANTGYVDDPYAAPTQPTSYDPGYDQPGYADPNTFQTKKSGSKLFLILGVILVLILLTGTFAVLFLINQGTDLNSLLGGSSTSETSSSDPDLNTESSEESSESSENTSSASPVANTGTPAADARVFDEDTLPLSWITQKFNNNDTDDNGNCLNENTCGESADPDEDGLSNIDEYNYNTDPLDEDTDNDGISDGNEVYVYFSHPRLTDSDEDGDEDAAELLACTDPIDDRAAFLTSDRIETLADNIEIWSLTEPTLTTLSEADDYVADDRDVGYITAACTADEPGESDNESSVGAGVEL
jgi:hypothetical protein